MAMVGAGFLDITIVAFEVTDPDVLLAVSSRTTPVTVPCPTSFKEGVPDRVRVLLSRKSQLGAVESVYVRRRAEENVELEKVNENGLLILATGGT
jgi:hypothetical protein